MKNSSTGFIERTLARLSDALEHSVSAEAAAEQPGLLQSLDPRVKVIGLLWLAAVAAGTPRTGVTLFLFGLAIALALASRIRLGVLAGRVWAVVFLFTGAIALPAIFLTPGDLMARVPFLGWPVTGTGLRVALRLVARAETAATFTVLLVLCTPWTHVLKALRILRVPMVAVVILGMTHRYIFLLLQGARDMFEARRCRLVGPLDGAARRRLAAAAAGVLLGNSLRISEEVFTAMQARGFRGEIRLLDDFRMKPGDWLALGIFIAAAAAALAAG